ncbi:hypothetical protein [Herbiconiux solani]|uniref:hypothetical protein n=1 Tax=Herbiconiux solani TaxID=661329 RepID=UPI000827208F|nr:hypothetical protein [Herbiconiux solani]
MTVILIDGPSGSGKTGLALRMQAGWAGPDVPTLIHLDSIYPGWDGLEEASLHLTDEVLRPLRAVRALSSGEGDAAGPRWRRYDWESGRPAEWHAVDAARPLIVEGCGALSRANEELADLTIWVETDDRERKRRALERDGELYAREWDRWEAQWRGFVAREDPRSLATMVVET